VNGAKLSGQLRLQKNLIPASQVKKSTKIDLFFD